MNCPAVLRDRLARCEKTLEALRREGQELTALAARLTAEAAAPSASRLIDNQATAAP